MARKLYCNISLLFTQLDQTNQLQLLGQKVAPASGVRLFHGRLHLVGFSAYEEAQDQDRPWQWHAGKGALVW